MPSYSPSPATRSGIQAQVDFLTELTRRTDDSLRRLSELNLHFAQQVMQDTAEATRQMASCSDPYQFAAAAARATQAAMQHLLSYQQQLAGALSGAQVDLTRGAQAMLPDSARYVAAALSQAMPGDAGDSAGAFPGTARADGSAPNGSGATHPTTG